MVMNECTSNNKAMEKLVAVKLKLNVFNAMNYFNKVQRLNGLVILMSYTLVLI